MDLEQFLATVNTATEKASAELKRINQYRGTMGTEAMRCSNDHFEMLRKLLARMLPDLAQATIASLRVACPSFLNAEKEREFKKLRGGFWTRAKTRETNLGRARNLLWRWLMDQMTSEELRIPALEEIVEARRLRDRSDTVSAEASEIIQLLVAVESVRNNLQQMSQIYSRDGSIEPSAELVVALAKAATAPTGGVDEKGTPVVHPDLLLKIRFSEYAYLDPPPSDQDKWAA